MLMTDQLDMPDLQYAASQDESMLRLKDQVLSKRC